MPFANQTGRRRRREETPKLYDTERVNRQIANAETRIKDAGYKPADADDRNWFEKLTNLPKDQNAFFDILEILGRPGTGVLNAINENLKGRSAAEGFVRGFAGRDRTRGADVAETMGIESGPSKFIVGTALDIGLDPVTYVPGGAIAKGVKTAATPVVNAGKGAYRALESSVPSVRKFREETLSPLAERGKDALGRGFVRDYKLDEDLYGRKDDTVKNLKQQTENNISFQTEQSMRNIADAAKAAGGIDTGTDVGRLMEKDLKVFDEQGNPLPRPEREYSNDPAIRQAAENLMNSNNELRQWAIDNGIEVGELEGYMRHILSREERKRRGKVKSMPLDQGNFGTGQPNKKVIRERELQGSVEDINERFGREFFEPNAFFATAVGQKQLIDYANAAHFRGKVLSNPNFAQKYEKGMQIPSNAVVIDTNEYKFINNDANEIAEEIGGQYIVTKSVKQALDRYKKLTSDEGINSFLKAVDTAQSWWKRGALFSPMYHVRNDIGAKFNNWIGGMSPISLAKYSKEGYQDVYNAVVRGNESPMYREFREQGLGSSGLSAIEFARRGEEPEDAIRKTIEKRSKFDGTLGGRAKAELSEFKKNPFNVFETSRDFGDFIDQTNRFALYKWARDKGMTPEQAAAKVREVQFDYSKTTPFEREVMTRLFPFYRWVRNNLPFQIRQFINDPRKYANINKVRLNAQEAAGIDDENVPDFMKESFAIPVYGDGSGDGKMLGLNLPIGDLTKVTDPLKLLIDATTPLAKLPTEVSLNRNFFFNKPIERFEGEEKQFQVPGTDAKFGIDPTLAYVIEQLTGQIGRGLSGYLQAPKSVDEDAKFRTPTFGINSLVKDFDAQKSEYFEQYQRLQELLDLLKVIEQQTGERPRTIQEIQRLR